MQKDTDRIASPFCCAKPLRALFGAFMAIVLAVGLMPAAPARAAYAEESNSSAPTAQSASTSAAEDASATSEAENAEDEYAAEALGQENSWRYACGERIASQDGTSTEAEDESASLSSVITGPSGKVFDWFDQFSAGYYTGTDALKGVDVSEHNGTIDWAKVKSAGVDYAIIRCGYGMDQPGQDDDQWIDNVKGCIANGTPFGVYLYSYATNTTRAAEEAQHVLNCLSDAGITFSDLSYPIYFDMEDASTADSDLAAIATTFCDKIEAAGGTVGIYSSKNWFENKLTASCFDKWTKWVAQWNTTTGLTYEGLSDFSSGNGMWQFSDAGSVPGINGYCDLDYTCASWESDDTGTMYRLYNPNSGEHFYTASQAERNSLITAGWNYEGIGWTAPTTSDTPVYRLYNPNPGPNGSGEHHYTMNAVERDMLVEAGWTYEGIGWYSDNDKSVPLYRLYNPNEFNNNHHYTTSKDESDDLVQRGWNDEGIAWYGV